MYHCKSSSIRSILQTNLINFLVADYFAFALFPTFQLTYMVIMCIMCLIDLVYPVLDSSLFNFLYLVSLLVAQIGQWSCKSFGFVIVCNLQSFLFCKRVSSAISECI